MCHVLWKWKEIGDLKVDASSLLMIVKHLMNTETTIYEYSENFSSEQLAISMENKIDALEKSLAELNPQSVLSGARIYSNSSVL